MNPRVRVPVAPRAGGTVEVMRGLVQRGVVRLAAALVALALAGVTPWLEPPHAGSTHHCQCPRGAGHHDCDCPLCQAEAARAGAASTPGAKVPPCHLAQAKKAAAAERQATERRLASGPVLSSACGSGDHRFDPPPSVPHFTVPQAPALAVHVTVAALDERLGDDLGVPVEPETPPPKQA
jgi:hypothetical protein